MSLCVMSVGGLRSLVATCHERGGSQQLRTHVFQAWRWGGVLATIQPCGMSVEVSAAMHPRVTSHGGGGCLSSCLPTCHEHEGLSRSIPACHEHGGGVSVAVYSHLMRVGWLRSCAPMSRAWGVSAAMHPHPRAWGGGVSQQPSTQVRSAGGLSSRAHTPHTPTPPRVTNSGQLGSHRPRTHVSRARAASALSAPVPTCPERARPQQPRTRVSPAWSWGCWGGVVSQHPPSTHSMSTQGLSPPSLSLRGHGAPKPATVPGELAARPGEAERPRPRCPCPPLLLPPPGRPHGRQ